MKIQQNHIVHLSKENSLIMIISSNTTKIFNWIFVFNSNEIYREQQQFQYWEGVSPGGIMSALQNLIMSGGNFVRIPVAAWLR